MKKPYLLCFFVFLLPVLGCIGSVNAEQILLANLSDVTAQSSEDELGTVVFTLLEAITGAEVDTVVDEEGFGVIRYGFGYEASALERAQDNLPPGFLDSLNCHSATKLLIEKAPEGSTLMEEKRGSATWCIVNVPFSNLLQLAEHYQAIFNTATYAADLENNAIANSESSGQNGDTLEAQPLIQLECLELVDGLFYQQFSVDETALERDDTDLMEVFGINLQWRLSMPGDIRNHNAPAKLTFPLAWDMLNAPETLNVNMQPGDACPSSRLKLLLEFTTTDTTLATLTVPISRDADDLGQNEDVRQRLAEQGWLTQIEGSANHSPRIVALRQFNQRELDQILATIPGLEGSAEVVRQLSPQTDVAKANEAASLAPVDLPTSVNIDLDLSKFTNTWAELMPNLPPTAFELDVNSIRTISNLEGQWSDSTLPYLLWNGTTDDVERELALTLTSDNFLPLAEADVDAKPEEVAAAEEIAATVGVSKDDELTEAAADVVSEHSEGLVASRLPERTIATRMTEENIQPLSVRVVQSPNDSIEGEDGIESEGIESEGIESEGEADIQPTSIQSNTPSKPSAPTATAMPEPTATATTEPTATNTSAASPTTVPTEVPGPATTVASARVALANATSQNDSSDLDLRITSMATGADQDDVLGVSTERFARVVETDVEPENAELAEDDLEDDPEGDPEEAQSSKENRSALTVAALVRSASSTPKTVGSLTPANEEGNEEAGEEASEEASEDETSQTVGDLLEGTLAISDVEASNVKTISDLIETGQDDASVTTSPSAEAVEQSSTAQPEKAGTGTADPAISLPECTVVIEWLNLRPGPGVEYGDPIAPLPQGTELFVVSQDPSGFWIEVTTEDPPIQGWVSMLPEFISCNGELSTTPTIDLANFEPLASNRLSTTASSSSRDTPAVKGLSDKD